MKRLIKTIGIAILLVTAAVLIEIPIIYLFNISGPIGKLAIIISLLVLLCLIIWRGMKSIENEVICEIQSSEMNGDSSQTNS